jgi:DNA-binding transcriptional ArsR family regulator
LTTTLEQDIDHSPSIKLESLGSVGILRVLECVTKQGSINISHLSRKTGLNHGGVDRHVKKLVELGLVEERWYGKLRMIRPTFDSLVVLFKKGLGVRIVRSAGSARQNEKYCS